MQLRKEWNSLEEIVGTALDRVESRSAGHAVVDRISGQDLPLVWVDGVLIEQVLINLLENAAKYSPPAG